MDGNNELLNFVFQNSQMGEKTIAQLLGINKDEDFCKCLSSQREEYRLISESAKTMLTKFGNEEKGVGALKSFKAYLMINIQTLLDKSSAHIAEMMIIGSNMGVISAIKNLKKYPNAQPEIIELMQRLLRFEENNIQQLKNFLA